jgi:putative nucleotidyltransferase with HDIG domain
MPNSDLIKAVLKGVDGLKPLPTTVTRALKLMEEPDTSIRQIVAVIAVDQALSARLLKFANSAYYGFPHQVTTLHEAVTRLGLRRTKNLLFTLSYSSLLGRRVASYNLGNGELWRHSIAVAMASQRLAERVAYAAPDEAYMGGLLHDIGKLMLDQYFKVNWDHLLGLGQTYQLTLIEAEKRLLGLDHAEVGAELARKWELPACLVEAIAYHHFPGAAVTSPKLAAIVHLADVIALRLGIGLPHPDFLHQPHLEALEILSLTIEELEFLTDQYQEMLSSYLAANENPVEVAAV